MSNITKSVDRAIAPQERTQVFTQADASAGDILMVESSLGHCAKTLQITSAGGMTIRFNVLRTIYPPSVMEGLQNPGQLEHLNLALGVSIEDTSQTVQTIAASGTFNLDKTIPIRDIKIVSVTGNFSVFVA